MGHFKHFYNNFHTSVGNFRIFQIFSFTPIQVKCRLLCYMLINLRRLKCNQYDPDQINKKQSGHGPYCALP